MLRPRVIPCLLIHDGGLVKTVKFDNPKYVGDPINAVRIFNEKEVDELVFLDIVASREGREPSYKVIEEIATASAQQTTGLSEINRAILQLESVTRKAG